VEHPNVKNFGWFWGLDTGGEFPVGIEIGASADISGGYNFPLYNEN